MESIEKDRLEENSEDVKAIERGVQNFLDENAEKVFANIKLIAPAPTVVSLTTFESFLQKAATRTDNVFIDNVL